jgi:hypothetical protein
MDGMSLLDAAKAAHHDLGKYVRFEQRWLPEGCSDAELLDALRADVLETRRGRTGVESAPQLWARLRPALQDLADRAEMQQVDAATAVLAAGLGELEPPGPGRARLLELSQACAQVASALSALVTSIKDA